MSDDTAVLVVTVDDAATPYEDGLAAINQLERGKPVEQPATIRFASEAQLTDVFNERTYRLLRVVRDDQPASVRETAAGRPRQEERPRGADDPLRTHPVRCPKRGCPDTPHRCLRPGARCSRTSSDVPTGISRTRANLLL